MTHWISIMKPEVELDCWGRETDLGNGLAKLLVS